MVTHPSTNRSRHRVTSLIETQHATNKPSRHQMGTGIWESISREQHPCHQESVDKERMRFSVWFLCSASEKAILKILHPLYCLFPHSGSQPSVDAHLQSLHRSSGTHCHLTSNHPRLCSFSVNVQKHSSVCNQPLRPTQPSTLSGMEHEYGPNCGDALRLRSKRSMVYSTCG